MLLKKLIKSGTAQTTLLYIEMDLYIYMRRGIFTLITVSLIVILSFLPVCKGVEAPNNTNPIAKGEAIVSNVTNTSAVISWYDEPGTIGIVYYGLSEDSMNSSKIDTSQRDNGIIYITLTDLKPGTKYYFTTSYGNTKADDTKNNTGTIYSFTTSTIYYPPTKKIMGKVVRPSGDDRPLKGVVVYIEVTAKNPAVGELHGIILSYKIDNDEDSLYSINTGYVVKADIGEGGNISFSSPVNIKISDGVLGGMEQKNYIGTETEQYYYVGVSTLPLPGDSEEPPTAAKTTRKDYPGFLVVSALLLIGMVTPMVVFRKKATAKTGTATPANASAEEVSEVSPESKKTIKKKSSTKAEATPKQKKKTIKARK